MNFFFFFLAVLLKKKKKQSEREQWWNTRRGFSLSLMLRRSNVKSGTTGAKKEKKVKCHVKYFFSPLRLDNIPSPASTGRLQAFFGGFSWVSLKAHNVHKQPFRRSFGCDEAEFSPQTDSRRTSQPLNARRLPSAHATQVKRLGVHTHGTNADHKSMIYIFFF